jgi:hypothetical protein
MEFDVHVEVVERLPERSVDAAVEDERVVVRLDKIETEPRDSGRAERFEIPGRRARIDYGDAETLEGCIPCIQMAQKKCIVRMLKARLDEEASVDAGSGRDSPVFFEEGASLREVAHGSVSRRQSADIENVHVGIVHRNIPFIAESL